MLIGLWREFVGRDDVGPATNFFAHGGHSLLGAQMVQRVEENLGVTLRLGDLFDHPTPAEFARAVEAASGREALDRKADNA
jgi:acyl carrier protein